MNEDDKKKMAEVGKLSKKYGEFLARNIVDIKFAYNKSGVKGVITILIKKIKNVFHKI